jgi:hypothetical protein
MDKKKTKQEKEYTEYVNYLWRVVISHVDSLKVIGSFKPLLDLEQFVEKHTRKEESNWLFARVLELKKTYTDWIGKPKSVDEALSS